MNIFASIVDGPLPAPRDASDSAEVGAYIVFDGIVRRTEDGRPLIALDYEAYEGMAQNELLALARDVATRHGVTSLHVWHSRGRVAVGEASLRVIVQSKHRKEVIAALDEFVDRLKRDVPIWKHPVFASERDA